MLRVCQRLLSIFKNADFCTDWDVQVDVECGNHVVYQVPFVL